MRSWNITSAVTSASEVSLYYLWTRSIRNTNYCFQSITFRGALFAERPSGTPYGLVRLNEFDIYLCSFKCYFVRLSPEWNTFSLYEGIVLLLKQSFDNWISVRVSRSAQIRLSVAGRWHGCLRAVIDTKWQTQGDTFSASGRREE